jgi:hypothetical protein
VLRWNSTGTTLIGSSGVPGVSASQLNTPVDIALTPSNTLYIADYFNNRVQKCLVGASSCVTVAGQANTNLSSTAAYLYYPAGVYVDSNENIYVSDSANHRVQLWINGATVGTTVAGTGQSEREYTYRYKYC